MSEMIVVSARITREMLREIDRLVERGAFPSRSELIRYAIHMLLDMHYNMEQAERDPVRRVLNVVRHAVTRKLAELNGMRRQYMLVSCERCRYPIAFLYVHDLAHVRRQRRFEGVRCPLCGSDRVVAELI